MSLLNHWLILHMLLGCVCVCLGYVYFEFTEEALLLSFPFFLCQTLYLISFLSHIRRDVVHMPSLSVTLSLLLTYSYWFNLSFFHYVSVDTSWPMFSFISLICFVLSLFTYHVSPTSLCDFIPWNTKLTFLEIFQAIFHKSRRIYITINNKKNVFTKMYYRSI